jgi:hypothetical protein
VVPPAPPERGPGVRRHEAGYAFPRLPKGSQTVLSLSWPGFCQEQGTHAGYFVSRVLGFSGEYLGLRWR